MVLKKVVAGFLVVCLLAWSWYDVVEAQTYTTDRGTFTLTSSGVTRITAAQQTVANAVSLLGLLGRVAGPVMVGFAVWEAVTQFWDWWSRDYTVPSPSTPSTTAGTWGLSVGASPGVFTQTGYSYVLCGPVSPWPGVKQWVLGSAPSFANIMVVGAQTFYQGSYDCYTTVLQLMSAPSTSSAVRTSSTGVTGRPEMIAAIDSLLAEMNSGTFQSANNTGTDQQRTAGLQEMIDTLTAARTVLSQGVQLTSGVDYTGSPASSGNPAVVGPMPGAVPLPGEPFSSSSTSTSSGTDMTATNQKLDQMLNTPASPASAELCPECARVDKWTELWDTIKTAAASAPIFGLIARLAWPGSGTVQRQWTLGSWQGHQMSIDLDNSGIGTVIAVVRFVVVGGAVIVAYMIIFA